MKVDYITISYTRSLSILARIQISFHKATRMARTIRGVSRARVHRCTGSLPVASAQRVNRPEEAQNTKEVARCQRIDGVHARTTEKLADFFFCRFRFSFLSLDRGRMPQLHPGPLIYVRRQARHRFQDRPTVWGPLFWNNDLGKLFERRHIRNWTNPDRRTTTRPRISSVRPICA